MTTMVSNQIAREIRLFEWNWSNIYTYSLVILFSISFLHFILYNGGKIKLGLFPIAIIFLMVYMVLFNLFLGKSLIDSIVSCTWGVCLLIGISFSKEREFERYKRVIIICFVVVSVLATMSIIKNSTGSIYTRTNIIGVNYVFYFGVPILLLARKGERKIIELIISIFMILVAIFSFKRTSILAIGLALLLYYYSAYFKLSKRKKGWILFVGIALVLAIYWGLNANSYIVERFVIAGETGGNGRLETWEFAIKSISSSSLTELLFGHGVDSFRILYGISTHNDFLEVLYSYGLIGFLTYVLIFCVFLKKLIIAKKRHYTFFPPYVMTIVLFFVISFFSHIVVYSYVAVPVFTLIGYFIGSVEKGIINDNSAYLQSS